MNKFIINLHFSLKTIIGANKSERKKPQEIIVDLKIEYKGKLIDYSEVYHRILRIFESNKFIYLESALEFVIDDLYEEFRNIKKMDLKISKPQILPNCVASVRAKRDSGKFRKSKCSNTK